MGLGLGSPAVICGGGRILAECAALDRTSRLKRFGCPLKATRGRRRVGRYCPESSLSIFAGLYCLLRALS